MIIGDASIFAIDSSVTAVYSVSDMKVLGSFCFHVAGKSYGVQHPQATMLACSVDAIQARIARRGAHLSSFSSRSAAHVARLYLAGLYGVHYDTEEGLRTEAQSFAQESQLAQWVMAPDGDEAFDDGSHVLQFDLRNKVRLIAFRNEDGLDAMLDSISEVEMEEERFYSLLRDWDNAFRSECKRVASRS